MRQSIHETVAINYNLIVTLKQRLHKRCVCMIIFIVYGPKYTIGCDHKIVLKRFFSLWIKGSIHNLLPCISFIFCSLLLLLLQFSKFLFQLFQQTQWENNNNNKKRNMKKSWIHEVKKTIRKDKKNSIQNECTREKWAYNNWPIIDQFPEVFPSLSRRKEH